MRFDIQGMCGGLVLVALAGCSRAPAAEEPAAAAMDAAAAAAGHDEASLLARGEYVAATSGCNDCHSPGYAESGGQTPKSQWLVGTALGWNGPWGTTYPANLRAKVQGMDEATWLDYTASLHTRPPMPDFAVRAMTEQDRRALFRFIRSLGPGGQAAPAYLPPGQEPPLPFVRWPLPPPPGAAPAAG